MNKVVMVAKMDIMHVLNDMDFQLPKADPATAAECQLCQKLRSTMSSRYSITSWNEQSVTRWNVNYTGPISVWKGQDFVFTGMDPYSGYEFDFPACNAFAKAIISELTEFLIYHHDILYSIASQPGTHFTASGV